jgi:hypothetical protein
VRRALALALALVGAVATAPAKAAPSGSVEIGTALHVLLKSPRGTSTLELLASTPQQGGTPVLRLRLVNESGQVVRLAGALPAGALMTSGGVTTLRTRVGGLPLRAVWREVAYSAAAGFGHLEADDDDATGWTIGGRGGELELSLGSARCRTESGVVGTALVYDTAGDAGPLSRGLGVPARGLRCEALPSTDLPPVP